jgi:hypothetical protein
MICHPWYSLVADVRISDPTSFSHKSSKLESRFVDLAMSWGGNSSDEDKVSESSTSSSEDEDLPPRSQAGAT